MFTSARFNNPRVSNWFLSLAWQYQQTDRNKRFIYYNSAIFVHFPLLEPLFSHHANNPPPRTRPWENDGKRFYYSSVDFQILQS